MKPHKKERLEELLHQELNRLFLKETEFPLGAMVTLMRVELNPDASAAVASVSIFPAKYVDSVMKQLKKTSPFFLHRLIRRLKMHSVPAIFFKHDESNEQLAEIDRLLKEGER